MVPHELQPTRFLCPCDFSGTNSGVDCHFLLEEPNPGIKPASLALAGGFFTIEPPGKSLRTCLLCQSQFNQALTLLCQIFKASYLGSVVNEQSWFFFLVHISVAVSLHRMLFPWILVELKLPSLRSMLRDALLTGLPKISRSSCHLPSLCFLFSQPSLHPQSFHMSTSLLPVLSL